MAASMSCAGGARKDGESDEEEEGERSGRTDAGQQSRSGSSDGRAAYGLSGPHEQSEKRASRPLRTDAELERAMH